MVMKCTCKHEGQDKIHGKGMRVCNRTQAKNNQNFARCTVCKKEHPVKE